MPTNPIDLLFSAYRRQVLGLLLLRPDDSLHVREIARLTGVPAGSLHRELRALTEAGLLQREPAGNQVRYRANRACPIYPELTEIFRKTAGLADVLREALAPLAGRVTAAFVFGSLAQGMGSATSDVDVFVIGEADFSEVVALLSPLRQRLGREVNPVVMTPAEFAAQRKAKERFVTRVLREPKLFLIGTDDDLG
ncbi:ArsR family transcriptional regulator [Sulfuritortus calidifontis]|uniref:ArsR family transcriptional regulator n=1 Tax=Sulfuritortus calidifontis TaxID=1914471 RepID=A0A4R3JSZ0_9PROT|nr:MarR family transcriptional regulator [Sulfuritortus calidifontis]TCS68991.1 ArsR family transcriptional regulator [Sulfuritortus calidifontis]